LRSRGCGRRWVGERAPWPKSGRSLRTAPLGQKPEPLPARVPLLPWSCLAALGGGAVASDSLRGTMAARPAISRARSATAKRVIR
jgi:hypothetical protein